MEQETPKTVVNQTLLIWCGVVIVELFVIAHLMASPMALLFGLVLFFPIRAAMNWPAPLPTQAPALEGPTGTPAPAAAEQPPR